MATKQSVMGADKIRKQKSQTSDRGDKQNLLNDHADAQWKKLGKKNLRNENVKNYYNSVLPLGKSSGEFNIGKYQVDYEGKRVGRV